MCDTCAVSPHELGVLTCFGECRVAVAMAMLLAHPGLVQSDSCQLRKGSLQKQM